MPKRNEDIRDAIRRAGLTQWFVAERIGLSDSAFSRKLRHELSEQEKQMIYNVINEIQNNPVVK